MIYCIDVDGVLCSNEPEGVYSLHTPRKDTIEKVNKLYEEGHTIKIFTARGSSSRLAWRDFTLHQLEEWGVKYHELIMGKPSYDYIVDDRAITL